MQIPKLKAQIEADAMQDIEVSHDATTDGWIVTLGYPTRSGEQREILERQRGGVRVFTTLDAVARCLAGLGLTEFRVDAAGLTGEEAP